MGKFFRNVKIADKGFCSKFVIFAKCLRFDWQKKGQSSEQTENNNNIYGRKKDTIAGKCP